MQKYILAAVWVLVASGAQAATLNVVGGQLLGASGVDMDGSLYGVEFLDGTEFALYDGSDDMSGFTFQALAAAILASQALLDQVFLDDADGKFDSVPSRTNGCDVEAFSCNAFSPFGYRPIANGTGFVETQLSRNGDSTSFDEGAEPSTNVEVEPDQSFNSGGTFAAWTPAPEPTTALLLSFGLTGLSWAGGRRIAPDSSV
jgi:hypothetical protein